MIRLLCRLRFIWGCLHNNVSNTFQSEEWSSDLSYWYSVVMWSQAFYDVYKNRSNKVSSHAYCAFFRNEEKWYL